MSSTSVGVVRMSKNERDRIQAATRAYRDEMVTLSRQLVSIPTENPPGRSYRQCVDLLAQVLDKLGLQQSVAEVPGGDASYPRFCLLGSDGCGDKTLHFHGHYDVVPAADKRQFKPLVKGGRLYGRGSADMKSGLVSMIYAVKALKECGIRLSGRIGLTFVPDEETGGALGSRHLADADLLGRDGIGMLTPEPTSGVIWNANRGAISLLITVRGKAAHVCAHYDGVNAFERVLTVVDALRAVKSQVETRRTEFSIEPEAARDSVLLLGGRCEGGTNFNVVPGHCSFTVDRRINPEEDLDVERRRLFDVLDSLRQDGIDLEIDVLQEGRSAGTPDDSPMALALAESVKEVLGEAPRFEMCPGLLETRFYAERGIPALGYGPGLLSVSHGPDEYVEIDRMVDCAAIYALTAIRLLSP
jgi:acetylornithine deacetylase/succinyl-diaminopimelate desuccinylase family protein